MLDRSCRFKFFGL